MRNRILMTTIRSDIYDLCSKRSIRLMLPFGPIVVRCYLCPDQHPARESSHSFTLLTNLCIFLFMFFLCFFPFTAAHSDTPVSEWKSWEGKEYLIINERFQFTAARYSCLRRKADLASIHSAAEESAILGFMKE